MVNEEERSCSTWKKFPNGCEILFPFSYLSLSENKDKDIVFHELGTVLQSAHLRIQGMLNLQALNV